MVDAIILAIVAAVLFLAARGAMKHFKVERSCCCGGGETSVIASDEKRLENPIIGKKTVKISGMHCDKCARSVTEAINKIDGAAAKVILRNDTAIVSCDREISDEAIRRAVEKSGYRVESIMD